MRTEEEKFEAWASSEMLDMTTSGKWLTATGPGIYDDSETQGAHLGWMACASSKDREYEAELRLSEQRRLALLDEMQKSYSKDRDIARLREALQKIEESDTEMWMARQTARQALKDTGES